MTAFSSWQFWALASAAFAALTAIFAKIGIENVNSDFATFIRTIVILMTLALILAGGGAGHVRCCGSARRFPCLTSGPVSPPLS